MNERNPASNVSGDMAKPLGELIGSHPGEGFTLEHDPAPGGMHRLVSFVGGDIYRIDVFGRLDVIKLHPR